MILFQALIVSDGFAEAPTMVTRHLDDALHCLKSFRRVLLMRLLSPSLVLYSMQTLLSVQRYQSHLHR